MILNGKITNLQVNGPVYRYFFHLGSKVLAGLVRTTLRPGRLVSTGLRLAQKYPVDDIHPNTSSIAQILPNITNICGP